MTFEPDIAVLSKSLDAIEAQVAEVVVVDNGSGENAAAWLRQQESQGRIILLALGKNLGVATAHNRGMAVAQEKGYSHVLLLDHDSIPAPDMVEKLMAACNRLASEGKAIAAVGSRYYDPASRHLSSFVRFGWCKFTRVHCPAGRAMDKTPLVDFLISSGSLIPMRVVEKVGKMDEGLFVDHVDTEWFLRARAQGYHAYGACDAIMEHSLGSGSIVIWFGRRRYLPGHSPLRHYYIFRNSILLYKRKYAPVRWIINDLTRLVFMFVLYSLAASPRLQHLNMMFKGVCDGIRNRNGCIDAPR